MSGHKEVQHSGEGAHVSISGIISAIIVGAIIGGLGRLLLPGRQPIGIVLTVLIGIVAALVGTAIAQKTGVASTRGFDWIELVFQVGLAVLGVAAVAAWRRNRGHAR